MRNLLPFVAILGFSGCEEYYRVDDACFDTFAGGERLPATSVAAMSRINCYRHMTGVLKVSGDDVVQIAADGVVNYVLQNPDPNLLVGSIGPQAWLAQVRENPGFTGVNVYERLAGTDAGQAGYSYLDPIATETWEFIHIEIAEHPEDLPSGAAAIDHLMRYPEFRQAALQPSFVDGAYAELDLPSPWYAHHGAETTPGGGLTYTTNTSLTARVYYLVTLYRAPHLEHADRPVLLPKVDQVDVPLWSWSENRNVPLDDGSYADVQVSYPITLLMGAIDPAHYSPVDTNQYQAQFTAAAIAAGGDFLNVEAVHPGDAAEDVWPSGRFQRTTLALFADRPFEPSTQYTLYADYSSPEGDFSLEYSFKTAATDVGVDPLIGRNASTLNSSAARTRPLHTDYSYTAPRAASVATP